MDHRMMDVILAGLETVRGTAVAGTLTMGYRGEGLNIQQETHTAQPEGSSTFPDDGLPLAIGVTPRVTLVPEVNVETIRDLILMARSRTDGILKSFTLHQLKPAQRKVSGCVPVSLELSFSRSASPGE